MKPNKKIIAATIFISVLLIIELLDYTFAKILDKIIPCQEREYIIELPCYVKNHLWLIAILFLLSIAGFIYWLLKINPKRQKEYLKQRNSPLLKFNNLSGRLEIDKIQRIINALISTGLIITLIITTERVFFSSGSNDLYKYILLNYLLIVFILQTIINKAWLNFVLKLIFIGLLIYVIYTYIFAFFDPYDVVMRREYGLLKKTWQFLIKSSLITLIILFINKIKPKKRYASNTRLGQEPESW